MLPGHLGLNICLISGRDSTDTVQGWASLGGTAAWVIVPDDVPWAEERGTILAFL